MKFATFLLSSLWWQPATAQPDQTWIRMGSPKIGTRENRGIGEMVKFSSDSKVLMEAHHTWDREGPQRMNGWQSNYAFQVSLYLYEEAIADWIPLGEGLDHKFDEGYDTAMAQVTIQSQDSERLPHGVQNVALLESYGKYEDKDPEDGAKVIKCNARILFYTVVGGRWYENGALERPEGLDCNEVFWGRTMALSKNNNAAVGTISKEGGSIQLYKMVADTFLPTKWVPEGEPILGGVPVFGDVIEMSDSGDVILTRGCKAFDFDDGKDDCFLRVYQRGDDGTWSQMGSDLKAKDMKMRPGDAVALDRETGLSFVAGGRDVTPWCPETKNGGHVRVYEYSKSKNDWVQKGQDLDSLMDAKGAKDSFLGTDVSIGKNGTRVAVSAYWTDKTIGETQFVQTFLYNDDNMEWELEGMPLHTDGGPPRCDLSSDGTKLVIGDRFGSFYTGHMQTLQFNDDPFRGTAGNNREGMHGGARHQKWRPKPSAPSLSIGLRGASKVPVALIETS